MSDASGFQIGRDASSFYETHVSRFMAPFVEALVTRTVSAGSSVLDVACGTGFATRAAAAVAGSGARIEGLDLNPSMLDRARLVPDDSGAELRWRKASALALPYEDSTFDAVICQQGLQFFPDPGAGIKEMARVARDGGRLGATVWSGVDDTPFLQRETQMLARHGGELHAEFSATEQALRAWFSHEGVDDVSVELITVDIELPPVQAYVPEHLRALPWSASFFRLSVAQQAAALVELDDHLAEYRTDEGIRVPFSSYLVTATCRSHR